MKKTTDERFKTPGPYCPRCGYGRTSKQHRASNCSEKNKREYQDKAPQ